MSQTSLSAALPPPEALAHTVDVVSRDKLLHGFLGGADRLVHQAVQEGLLAPRGQRRLPILGLVQRIDEAIHSKPEVNPKLSQTIGRLLAVAEEPIVEERMAGVEVLITPDGSIQYDDAMTLWRQFLEVRIQKQRDQRLKKKRVLRERRRTFARQKRQLSAEIAERRAGYLEHQAESEARSGELQQIIDRRRRWRRNTCAYQSRKRLPELQKRLTADQVDIVSHLNLPDRASREILGISDLPQRVALIKERLGLGSRPALALWALHHGIVYDLPEPPHVNSFTIRQRLVACHLQQSNTEIASSLDITPKQVTRDVQALLAKTQARTRTELALIARRYDFMPTSDEVENRAPDALKQFTEYQKPIVERLHMPYAVIAGELGISANAVARALQKAAIRANADNITELALKLQQQGLVFDVNKPKRSLGEVLTSRDLQIARALSLPNEAVARLYGLTDDQVAKQISYIKTKAGARTRVELALMAHAHDDNGRPEYHNVRPRQDRLFEALGIDPIPLEQVATLLRHTTPRRAEFITAYYLSGEELSWRAIGKQFSVRREAAIQLANRGLAQIKEQLAKQLHEDETPAPLGATLY